MEATAAARFFRVLGDPTRLRILELVTKGERTVSDLVTAVGQAQPRVSTHLACLRYCGLVRTERRGKEIVYRLALERLDDIFGAGCCHLRADRGEVGHTQPDWSRLGLIAAPATPETPLGAPPTGDRAYLTFAEGFKLAAQTFRRDVSRLSCCAI